MKAQSHKAMQRVKESRCKHWNRQPDDSRYWCGSGWGFRTSGSNGLRFSGSGHSVASFFDGGGLGVPIGPCGTTAHAVAERRCQNSSPMASSH